MIPTTGTSRDPFESYGTTAEDIVRGIWAGRSTLVGLSRRNGRTLRTRALVRAARQCAQDDSADRTFENETRPL